MIYQVTLSRKDEADENFSAVTLEEAEARFRSLHFGLDKKDYWYIGKGQITKVEIWTKIGHDDDFLLYRRWTRVNQWKDV